MKEGKKGERNKQEGNSEYTSAFWTAPIHLGSYMGTAQKCKQMNRREQTRKMEWWSLLSATAVVTTRRKKGFNKHSHSDIEQMQEEVSRHGSWVERLLFLFPSIFLSPRSTSSWSGAERGREGGMASPIPWCITMLQSGESAALTDYPKGHVLVLVTTRVKENSGHYHRAVDLCK